MSAPIVPVNFNGPAPGVKVSVGDALQASYTIAVLPPDHDLTKALTVCVADAPDEVDALHSLSAVWSQCKPHWGIAVYGGIVKEGDTDFPLEVQLVDGEKVTDFHIVMAKSSGSATFVAVMELVQS